LEHQSTWKVIDHFRSADQLAVDCKVVSKICSKPLIL